MRHAVFVFGVLVILAYGGMHLSRHFTSHAASHETVPAPVPAESAAETSQPENAASLEVRLFADRAEPGEIALRSGQTIVFVSEEGIHDMAEGEGNAENRSHTHNYGARHSGELAPGSRYEATPSESVRYYHDHLNPDIFVKVNVVE